MSDWLELELAEELRPTAAPEELWDRICSAGPRPVVRRAARHRPSVTFAWPVAAMVTMMIAAATLWFATTHREPVADLEQLAQQQIDNPAPLDMQSSDPAEVGAWLHRQAGVSLPLPAHSEARLVGARIIRSAKAPIAAVSYQVGDDTATLLIAKAGVSTDTSHGRCRWKSHGQPYALACSNPDRPEAACILCHTSL